MKYLKSILTSLVFVHALLTAPLLVQCIPPDGRYLVEMLGQDPCYPHHEVVRIPSAQDFDSVAITNAGEETDPCADLLLDTFCETSICSDLLIPAPQAHKHAAHLPSDGLRFFVGVDSLRPEPGKIVLHGYTTRLTPVLRI